MNNYPSFQFPNIEVPDINIDFPTQYMWSDTQFEIIRDYIQAFEASVDGNEATLIQHAHQLNFLLTKVRKEPDRPKRTIGFTAQD